MKCCLCRKEIYWAPRDYFDGDGNRCCKDCYEAVQSELKRRENERKQRENEHKLSHCHQCNNKSTLFHYIFDKRTKKMWDSWSNATDPENQLVFCNDTCFNGYLDKEFSFKCEQCCNKIKFNQNYYPLKGNNNIKFCSRNCGLLYITTEEQKKNERDKKELERLEKQINSINKETSDALYESMKKSEDISHYDWENADWLNEEAKEFCRKYVKNLQEMEDIKRQKNAMKNESASKLDSDNLEASLSEIVSDNSNSNNFSPNNQPSNQNSPSNSNNNSSNKPSSKLKIDPPSCWFNDSNGDQTFLFEKTYKEILEEINKEGTKVPVLLSPKMSKQQITFLHAWQRAKLSNECIDIDKLDLPQDKKQELYKLFKASQVNNFGMILKNEKPKDKGNPLPKILIVVFVIILIVVPAILIIRTRRGENWNKKLK